MCDDGPGADSTPSADTEARQNYCPCPDEAADAYLHTSREQGAGRQMNKIADLILMLYYGGSVHDDVVSQRRTWLHDCRGEHYGSDAKRRAFSQLCVWVDHGTPSNVR